MRARRIGGSLVGSIVACVALVGAGTAAAQIIGPPEISNVSSSGVTETQATVNATIEPRGHGTVYEVLLTYSPCQGGAGECAQPPVRELVGHGKLPARKTSRTVSTKVRMLTPGCDYSYWLVASNSAGTVESEKRLFTASGGKSGPTECSR